MGSIPTEQALLLKAKHHLRFMVETGTYKAQSARWAAQYFDWVYTIEGNRARFEKNAAAFRNNPPSNIAFCLGDSRHELRRVLATVNAPCLLWLDAHMCNETYDPNEVGGECPIREELAAINASAFAAQHVILIDDARYFTGRPPYPHDPAQWATYDEIKALLASRHVSIENDVIYAEPL